MSFTELNIEMLAMIALYVFSVVCFDLLHVILNCNKVLF